MKNLKIRAKILTGFSLVMCLGMILGAAGILSTRIMTKMTGELNLLQSTSNSINNVLSAHYVWRQGITEAALGGAEFTGSLDPNTCALGKWKTGHEAASITDSELLAVLGQIETSHAFIHTKAADVVAAVTAGDTALAAENLAAILPRTQEVIAGLTQMQQRCATLAEQKNAEIISFGNMLTWAIAMIIAMALAAGVILAFYISGLISKPLVSLTHFMSKAGATGDITLNPADLEMIHKYGLIKDEIGQCLTETVNFVMHVTSIAGVLSNVADGDLTRDFSALSEKDIMGVSLNKINKNFNNMFSDIRNASNHVSAGSVQIADGSQLLAKTATEQAATVQQLSAAIADIATKTNDNAQMASDAAKLASVIMQNAEKGNRQMSEMTDAVNEINTASQDIGKVIKVIDDIAFQTNILALNAAVEAARAGQHGKGFAVVSDEVRNLAAKSAAAAKDTGTLIANSMEKAQLGAKIATDTAASLTEIVSGISKSTQIVGRIAVSSEEQNAGIRQINDGINQVALVVQQNSATAEQSAASSEELSSQATVLKQLVGRFRLKSQFAGSPTVPVQPQLEDYAHNAGFALRSDRTDS